MRNMKNILSQFELPKDTQGIFKGKCRHCPAFISGSLKITSNFNTHIKVSKNMKILINCYVLICLLYLFNCRVITLPWGHNNNLKVISVQTTLGAN
jgi:hypothetical protein